MILKQNEIITKGAEAIIFSGTFLQTPIILKQRLPKIYRMPQIDETIRRRRLRAEARVMTLAQKHKVKVPKLLGVDIHNQTLFIEKIQGSILFSLLQSLPYNQLAKIFAKLGNQIAILHRNDIIHGDLTVFNVIIKKELESWLIDFGLSSVSVENEKKADDLLTFYNTLKAVTPIFRELFEDFKMGYTNEYELGKNIFQQMKKIQSRARYIAREDRIE